MESVLEAQPSARLYRSYVETPKVAIKDFIAALNEVYVFLNLATAEGEVSKEKIHYRLSFWIEKNVARWI